MKKILISFLFLFCFVTITIAQTFIYQRVTAAATVTIAATNVPATIYVYSSGAVVLGGDYNLNIASTPATGTKWRVYINLASTDMNGHAVNIFGLSLTAVEVALGCYIDFFVINNHVGTPTLTRISGPISENLFQRIRGEVIIDGTLPYSAFAALSSTQLLVGSAGNVATARTITGDVTIGNTGITAIGANVIVDGDVSISAGIARNKLAAGVADWVVINDGSGNIAQEAQLSTLRGGLGASVSGATGFTTFSAGSVSVGNMTDSKVLTVSFDSSSVGDFRGGNKVKFPFDGTITGIYAYATKTIAGVNTGVITAKNNAGTTMTNGIVTFSASDARGTAYSVSPSSNNTFVAGDVLDFFTSKADDPGGQVLLTITYTRTR